MKRFFLLIIAALASAGAAIAVDWNIHSIEINYLLLQDGSARIREIWDMETEEGSEVYIPRQNLGDMEISDFSVSDEEYDSFDFVDSWDVDWSRSRKAGHCGINRTSKGIELCWGIGRYGHHRYVVTYKMSNVIKSAEDYDYLHIQFINSDMAVAPDRALVKIDIQERYADTSWVRVWGFGYEGTAGFIDGDLKLETDGKLNRKNGMIALVRFDKGWFQSQSSPETSFKTVLDRAMQGAEYDDDEDEDSWFEVLLAFCSMALGFFSLVFVMSTSSRTMTRKKKKKLLGMDPKDVQWYKTAPMDGDIYKSDFVLDLFHEKRKENSIASAIILRLIYKGYLIIRKDDKERIEIMFDSRADLSLLDKHELGLYNMMKEASGRDVILQDKEFSRWSSKSRNFKKVRDWADGMHIDSQKRMQQSGYYEGKLFSYKGQQESQHLLGFKKYLEEFTLIDERTSVEVALWQDYLVFGALFGIADRVAKELKDIDPKYFEEMVGGDFGTFYQVIYMTNVLSRSITNARAAAKFEGSYGKASGGFGGMSSFGGGGGFHGGGIGGGVR